MSFLTLIGGKSFEKSHKMSENLINSPTIDSKKKNQKTNVVETKPCCMVCGKESSLRCSNCGEAVYCSREHQKEDWSAHKPTCQPFKVQHDDRLGRYLVASRDIRADEVVLKESPIIRGPSQLTEPVCLICLQSLMPGTAVPCDSCGWLMCSEKCLKEAMKDSSDHQFECRMTREKEEGGIGKISIKNFVCPHPMYQSILAMRCMMLREVDPSRWKKFSSLESLCEQRKGTEQWSADREAIAKFILRFYKPKTAESWTEEEILRVVGIAQINGHEAPISVPPSISVYAKASLVEHNCRSNLSKSFTDKGEIVLWSRFPIKKGTHLSICYTDALWGTEARRHHLKQTKFFDCTCERCLDVAEFGTNFSSVKCSGFSEGSACPGLLLPKTENDLNGSWTCGKCKVEVPYAQINEVLTRAGRDLEGMRGSTENCERFVDKNRNSSSYDNLEEDSLFVLFLGDS